MKNGWWLLIIIAVGSILRVVNLFTISSIEIDGIAYAHTAGFFAKGDFVTAMKGLHVPFYPLVIGLFQLLVGNIEAAGRSVSMLAGIMLIPLCYYFTKRYFREGVALFSAAAVAIHPYLTSYSAAVLSESLATLVFSGAVFFFYGGLIERKASSMAISGLLLTLAYLTRSEYIIYFLPLTAILIIKERRYIHTALFLICFLVLAFAFLFYIRIETGFWVIDRRMLLIGGKTKNVLSAFTFLLGTISPATAISHIPEVVLNFCIAISIPFILLAGWGFPEMVRRYRFLILVLVTMHILGRALTPYSTPRYSIEFSPIVAIFAAQGAFGFQSYMQSHLGRKGIIITILVFALICILSIFMGITNPNSARQLEKEAGIYMRGKASGSVAARLPISSFYAQSKWFYLGALVNKKPANCRELAHQLQDADVVFIAVDDQMEKEFPVLKSCLKRFEPMILFSKMGEHVKVYTLENLWKASDEVPVPDR